MEGKLLPGPSLKLVIMKGLLCFLECLNMVTFLFQSYLSFHYFLTDHSLSICQMDTM